MAMPESEVGNLTKNRQVSIQDFKQIPDWFLPFIDYLFDKPTLKFWESKGWMKESHPYGWVQWYCDFFNGKRGPDDERQIDRWTKTAGPRSRFRRALINMIHDKKTDCEDVTVSPKIRQTLQHWAYRLTKKDSK